MKEQIIFIQAPNGDITIQNPLTAFSLSTLKSTDLKSLGDLNDAQWTAYQESIGSLFPKDGKTYTFIETLWGDDGLMTITHGGPQAYLSEGHPLPVPTKAFPTFLDGLRGGKYQLPLRDTSLDGRREQLHQRVVGFSITKQKDGTEKFISARTSWVTADVWHQPGEARCDAFCPGFSRPGEVTANGTTTQHGWCNGPEQQNWVTSQSSEVERVRALIDLDQRRGSTQ